MNRSDTKRTTSPACEICDISSRHYRRRCKGCGKMACVDCRHLSPRYCYVCYGETVRNFLEPYTRKSSDRQIWIYCNGLKVYGTPIKFSDL